MVLEILERELKIEFEKAAARIARKQAKSGQ
jgi:hypothetical protein